MGGDLYVLDHEGNQLHPPKLELHDTPHVGQFDNLVLYLDVGPTGSSFQCIVNGVETNQERKQVVIKYKSDSRSGILAELFDVIAEELFQGRGWTISTVENHRNPGYVFQRLRNAMAEPGSTPQHVPPEHEAIQALLERGTDVTIRVRDYGVAGDLLVRYADVGRNVTVAESQALKRHPTGLVIVQDDSVTGATELADESKTHLRNQTLDDHRSTIEKGVQGLADLSVGDEEVAGIINTEVSKYYDGVSVIGPEKQQVLEKLGGNVSSLKKENARLRERVSDLEGDNERLKKRLNDRDATPEGTTDGGHPKRSPASPPSTASNETTNLADQGDENARQAGLVNKKVIVAILIILSIIVLGML